MNFNTFKYNDIIVNSITFKFPNFDEVQKTKICQSLNKVGFESFQDSNEVVKSIENTFPRRYKPTWDGNSLNFSGDNARRFYHRWKRKMIDRTIFSDAILSRLDLSYSRIEKPEDEMLTSDFLDQVFQELQETEKKVTFNRKAKKSILKIGNRANNLYYQIYDGKSFLRFEHEMKGRFLKKFNSFFMGDDLETFERELSSHFFTYSKKLLPLNYLYLDWLMLKLRPIFVAEIPKNYLHSNYVYKNTFELLSDQKDFLRWLKLRLYVQKLNYIPDPLHTSGFRQLVFSLEDFMKYLSRARRSSNKVSLATRYTYYKAKKLLMFFNQLQKPALMELFQRSTSRNLILLPEIKIEKTKTNIWIIKVWITDNLFYYAYPFVILNFLPGKLDENQLEIQYKFVETFSTTTHLEKKFLMEDFFNSYTKVLDTQEKTKIKQLFLNFINLLQENNLIESRYKVLTDGVFRSVEKLTINNISEGFIVYEKTIL